MHRPRQRSLVWSGLPGRGLGAVGLAPGVVPDGRLGDAATKVGHVVVTQLRGREASLLKLVADTLYALDVIQLRAQLHHHRLRVLVVDGCTSIRRRLEEPGLHGLGLSQRELNTHALFNTLRETIGHLDGHVVVSAWSALP